ncbi:MAG: DUF488 family protein [bacterium]|nr:DUF488 family protein [bacterium]
MPRIRLSRVYNHETHAVAATILVERLCPRGVRKESLTLDGSLRDVASSTESRTWFAHDPQKWQEFRRRYFAELDARPEAWRPLVYASRSGDVSLLYSSHDQDHKNAVALRDYLLGRITES